MSRSADKQRKYPRLLTPGVILIILLLVVAAFLRGADWGKQENSAENADNPEVPALGGYSGSLVDRDPSAIPAYSGEGWVELEDNQPGFNDYDKEYYSGEKYSDLDKLGRCGTAWVRLDRSMMPTEERGQIGHIKPSGWVQEKYPGLVNSEPPYLYNRCHLVAYALTGQNANEKNLITGTRYMNVELMLPWEEKVMRYLDGCDGEVLYRVSPYFQGNELVARGVELEAWSLEDAGQGLCFHVFVYNVQPGVEIDYRTGESRVEE